MARKQADSLRFTRVKIHNWMNFRDAEVLLLRRAFLIGPNASGKSNFLDVFRFLSDIARPAGGGLQAAIEARRGFVGVRSLHARGTNSFVEIEVDVGTDVEQKRWSYELRFNKVGKSPRPRVIREIVRRQGQNVVDREITDDDEAMSQTLVEQASANVEFREFVEFLRSARYLHVVPQVVRDRRRALEAGHDPHGGDLLRRMKQMTGKRRDKTLGLIAEALKIAVPQFTKLSLEDDENGVPHLIARFQHWRGPKAKQNEEYFSDGTLRLVGLLWSLSEKGGPLLLEEPELSLNDSVVNTIPSMFSRMQEQSGRQIIATTHSAALFDNPDVGLKEVYIIEVDENGSTITTLYEELQIRAQVDGGMTISEAVLPLMRPRRIEDLAGVSPI